MIEAVIFDMDGLLIDSEPFWRQSEMAVFADNGIYLTEDDCRKTTGMRIDEAVQDWDNIYTEIALDVDGIVNSIMKKMIDAITKYGDAMPGVFQCIDLFHSLNIPMALASASNFDLINVVVDRLNLKEHLKVIESAENMAYGKPHPEIFIETAKKLGVNPENCLVFEDSLYGVIAGKAARMKVVAVPEIKNFTKREFSVADFKIVSLEWFNASILDELQ